mmetsp:Transcript_8632/g.27060  ORF Transcript_8632/g.27060 Transcript_8632/m.27060 type:complete len:233 (+) Transcript_8632:1232-1930(+)
MASSTKLGGAAAIRARSAGSSRVNLVRGERGATTDALSLVASSTRTMPVEKTSAGRPYDSVSPKWSSGAMYSEVPHRVETRPLQTSVAMPKSPSLTCHEPSRRTFDDFMSRCIRFRPCRYATASASSRAIRTRRYHSIFADESSRSRSRSPHATYSVTIHVDGVSPSSSPPASPFAESTQHPTYFRMFGCSQNCSTFSSSRFHRVSAPSSSSSCFFSATCSEPIRPTYTLAN